MPNKVAGFPYWEIEFDETGKLTNDAAANAALTEVAGLTDLFIFSHGWNNDTTAARDLYERFFSELRTVVSARKIDDKGIGTVGIIWPSMRWADEEPPGRAQGAAALNAKHQISDGDLVKGLLSVFKGKSQQVALEAMAKLLDEKKPDDDSLKQFQIQMKSFANSTPDKMASEDNGEEHGLFSDDAANVFHRFAALAPRRRVGGAAGLENPFSALWSGAKEALRAASYWQMKKRAGVVGQDGLGPWLKRLQQKNSQLKVHLIGHSFGARLVSYSLTSAQASPPFAIESVFLLQGAFSHFAFAQKLPFDEQRSGALAGIQARVDGPICVTHSQKDTAVGTGYPLASIASRDDSSAVSDELYRWGAMGHDGAQASGAAAAALGPVGSKYSFGIGTFINLDANNVITQGGPPSGAHSDIVHPEIAWALLSAARLA